MRYVPPKFETLSEMAAIDVGRLTEDQAREILEKIRWPEGPVCPHCNGKNVTRLQGESKKTRDGVIQCNDCRGQFSVILGTIMHGSHITLRQWVQAFHSMCSHKKGVSALQLQRNLGLGSYRSAWHLAHRLRFAKKVCLMLSTPGGSVMNGINLYNVMRAMPFHLITHNVGNIDSIGNAVFLTGEERYSCPRQRSCSMASASILIRESGLRKNCCANG